MPRRVASLPNRRSLAPRRQRTDGPIGVKAAEVAGRSLYSDAGPSTPAFALSASIQRLFELAAACGVDDDIAAERTDDVRNW
jgi:hypothetical protein